MGAPIPRFTSGAPLTTSGLPLMQVVDRPKTLYSRKQTSRTSYLELVPVTPVYGPETTHLLPLCTEAPEEGTCKPLSTMNVGIC